jgi:hypothetical protein
MLLAFLADFFTSYVQPVSWWTWRN